MSKRDCSLSNEIELIDQGSCKPEAIENISWKFVISQTYFLYLNHSNRHRAYIFRKKRKRIETLFSQLCDQFMIRRNYAKPFQGLKTRILSKITALTTIQYINKFIFDRNINNIKTSIIQNTQRVFIV